MRKEELPYVILKYASTINGIIGSNNGQRLMLSNDLDREKVMEIRSQVDAILIGAGTLIADDPQLTVRVAEFVIKREERGLSPQPIRVVLGKSKIPRTDYKLFTDELAETILFTDQVDSSIPEKVKQILNKQEGPQILNALMELKQLGVNSVLIEGGAKIIAQAIELNLADRIRILFAPFFANSGVKVSLDKKITLAIKEKKIENLNGQFALDLKISDREFM